MNDTTWQLVKRVFWEVQELPVEEREAYAREACASDSEALRDVLGMLAGEAAAESSFLESPLPKSTSEIELPSLPRRLDDFELLEELGRGGMGVVYRARQLSLDREVAVKVLPADFTLDERLVERFQREARAVGKLRHAGIVPVYTEGKVGREHYFVMELVKGHDLYHELRRLLGKENGEHYLPGADSHEYLTAVVDLVSKVASSLAYAHAHGVVHRDVKPSNLILERLEPGASPNAQVLDFGLARDTAQGLHSLSHEVAGTPHYMSPEQLRAKSERVDERTDLYSLGIVLYELLTLTHPFHGTTNLEVMQQISHVEPRSPRSLNPRISRELETICKKAIEKRPEDRYASMQAFADDLRRFLNHEAIEAVRPTLRARVLRHVRRHRRSYAAACVGAFLIAAAALGAWSLGRVAEVEARRASLRALALRPLDELSTIEAQSLQREARQLAALVDEDSEAGLEAAAAMEALAEHLARLIAEGRAVIHDELHPEGDIHTAVIDEGRFHAALGMLQRAHALAPEDQRLEREANASHYDPRVLFTLDAEQRAAADAGRLKVYYASHSWAGVGEMRELQGWQRGPVLLPASDYRFRVELEGAGAAIAEYTRWLGDRGRTYEIAPKLVPHDEAVVDMVLIPGSVARVGSTGDPEFPWESMHDVLIPDFWIDRTEVTNAEYRDFLRATGRPAHWMWASTRGEPPTFDYPESWGDKAVSGVYWFDARDYAEWCGKRLPTAFEWQKAAAGEDAWLVPWAPEPGEGVRFGEHAVVERDRIDPLRLIESYAQHVVAVGAPTDDVTPLGLKHMLGNVSEWTENVKTFGNPGRPVVARHSRMVLGLDWVSPEYTGVVLHRPSTRSYHNDRTGIRCVRGAP
ncbi:MAG: hypothetical protein DHS20C15_30030 [Planctomycetota bacterium]|nr:MAG: hypothetical protein DHS20C15_30030 [Planctomycetota bacterium]